MNIFLTKNNRIKVLSIKKKNNKYINNCYFQLISLYRQKENALLDY